MPVLFLDILGGYPFQTTEVMWSEMSDLRGEFQVELGLQERAARQGTRDAAERTVALVGLVAFRNINNAGVYGGGDTVRFGGGRLEAGLGARWQREVAGGLRWTELAGTLHAGLVVPEPQIWAPQGNWGVGAQWKLGGSFGSGPIRPVIAAEAALWLSGAWVGMDIETPDGSYDGWSIPMGGARAAALIGVEWRPLRQAAPDQPGPG